MAQQNLRARQQQRQRFIIILVLLALLGAAVFFFLNGGDVSKKKKVAPRPKGQVAVPVIKKDIPIGTRLSNKSFTVKFMKPNEVPTDAILSVDEFIGRFITRPLLEGHYIKQGDVGVEGAVGGFSAMTRPGKRLISLPANLFPGALETLRVGDHIDLLAFEGSSTGLRRGRGKSLADSSTTLQGGGSQPGDPNSQARINARARARSGTGLNANATNATLIAENAEVMSVPSTKEKKKRKKGGDYLVLQMGPQDAHITTLMAATGTTMRTVFRPYGDETRLTEDGPAKITTRFPKSVADPDNIMMIEGGSVRMVRPNSKYFIDENARNIQSHTNMNINLPLPQTSNVNSQPIEASTTNQNAAAKKVSESDDFLTENEVNVDEETQKNNRKNSKNVSKNIQSNADNSIDNERQTANNNAMVENINDLSESLDGYY